MGDVDQAGRRVLKSWPGFQVWGVNVHQQHPQNHLTIRSMYICVGTDFNRDLCRPTVKRERMTPAHIEAQTHQGCEARFSVGSISGKRVFRSLVRYCGVYAFSVEGQRAYIVLTPVLFTVLSSKSNINPTACCPSMWVGPHGVGGSVVHEQHPVKRKPPFLPPSGHLWI